MRLFTIFEPMLWFSWVTSERPGWFHSDRTSGTDRRPTGCDRAVQLSCVQRTIRRVLFVIAQSDARVLLPPVHRRGHRLQPVVAASAGRGRVRKRHERHHRAAARADAVGRDDVAGEGLARQRVDRLGRRAARDAGRAEVAAALGRGRHERAADVAALVLVPLAARRKKCSLSLMIGPPKVPPKSSHFSGGLVAGRPASGSSRSSSGCRGARSSSRCRGTRSCRRASPRLTCAPPACPNSAP